jgi:hypothetical protein
MKFKFLLESIKEICLRNGQSFWKQSLTWLIDEIKIDYFWNDEFDCSDETAIKIWYKNGSFKQFSKGDDGEEVKNAIRRPNLIKVIVISDEEGIAYSGYAKNLLLHDVETGDEFTLKELFNSDEDTKDRLWIVSDVV